MLQTVMRTMPNSLSWYLCRLQKKIELEKKKIYLFIVFFNIPTYQPSGDFCGWLWLKHKIIKPFMSKCLPYQCLLNFTSWGGAVARQHSPPPRPRVQQCCNFYCLPSYPYTHLDRPLALQEVQVPRISRQLAHEGCKVVGPMQPWVPLKKT
jgi:hypothetical protein